MYSANMAAIMFYWSNPIQFSIVLAVFFHGYLHIYTSTYTLNMWM